MIAGGCAHGACIHVVPGTAWVVEALAALGILTLAGLIGVGLAAFAWHLNEHRQGRR